MQNIETERLVLRPYTPADAPFILELLNTPKWIQFIGDKKVYQLEDAEAYLQNRYIDSYEKHGFGLMAVELKSTNQTIGSCGLVHRESLPDVDLGFAFLPAHIGKGYGSEAAQAMIDYTKNHLNLDRLAAITLPVNSASIGLLKKLGFKYEKNITFEENGEELEMYMLKW